MCCGRKIITSMWADWLNTVWFHDIFEIQRNSTITRGNVIQLPLFVNLIVPLHNFLIISWQFMFLLWIHDARIYHCSQRVGTNFMRNSGWQEQRGIQNHLNCWIIASFLYFGWSNRVIYYDSLQLITLILFLFFGNNQSSWASYMMHGISFPKFVDFITCEKHRKKYERDMID